MNIHPNGINTERGIWVSRGTKVLLRPVRVQGMMKAARILKGINVNADGNAVHAASSPGPMEIMTLLLKEPFLNKGCFALPHGFAF